MLRMQKGTRKQRKGVILLVVLAMLVLLTIIGITFVSYAQSLEAISEAARDGESADTIQRFDPGVQAKKYWSSEAALSTFIGQLGFDQDDDDNGKYSVLRGHGLARNLYGYAPVNGVGLQTFPLDRPFGGSGYPDTTRPNFLGQATITGQPNVPYTAPDQNHWYLAKVGYNQQGKLVVIEPSFWRNIPSCTNPTQTAQSFRYRPNAEASNKFPAYPTVANKFDVINLPGGTNPDSIWIDINAPIITLPNGKRIKPMVAPLIIDLDGRLNVNMAGNRMTTLNNQWFHASHEGYGPWEANLDKTVALLANLGDVPLASYANGGLQNQLLNTKYGSYGFPHGYTQGGGGGGGGGGGATSNYSPRAHNQVNFNGGLDPNPNPLPGHEVLTGPIPAQLAGSGRGSTFFQAFPYFHPGVFGNWAPVETSSNGQGTGNYIHPNGYNPLFPNGGFNYPTTQTATNISFPIRDMGPLLLWRSDKDQFTVDPFGQTPTTKGFGDLIVTNNPLVSPSKYGNFDNRSALFDHVTLLGADFDKPGLYPYMDDKTQRGLQWTDSARTTAPFWPRRPNNAFAHTNGEKNAMGLAVRDLTRYARINLTSFGPDYPAIDFNTGLYADPATAATADLGRKLLAQKILDGLCAATGTPDMRELSDPTNVQYRAWVWLGQLAVNIVDFVDPDDVMTVLDLSPAAAPGTGRKVYGTELPKVVINELYAQIDNGSLEDFNKTGTTQLSSNFNVNLFLELLNPLNDQATSTNVNRPNTAYLQFVNGTNIHTIYEIEVTKSLPTAIKDPFATITVGMDTVQDSSGVINFVDERFKPSPSWGYIANTPTDPNPWKDLTGNPGTVYINPIGSNFSAANPKSGDQGILWIGPAQSKFQEAEIKTNFQLLEQSQTTDPTKLGTLSYQVDKSTGMNLSAAEESVVLLRRLVNPGLPANLSTNPYVLVDYVSVKKDMIQDARKRLLNTENSKYDNTPRTQRVSYGRRQPYGGKDIVSITGPEDLGAYAKSTRENTSAPKHTFGSLNFNTQPAALTNSITAPTETAETPDWLAHFDRVPASPLALMMVSTYRPHELCQKYLDQITNPADASKPYWVPHQHAAAWLDEMTGLQRFFDLVQTHGEHALTASGATNPLYAQVPLFPTGGRIQGRVNLNTVPIFRDAGGTYRSPVLEALFDANGTSRFTQDQIRSLINAIGQHRDSGNYFQAFHILNRAGSILQSKAMGSNGNPTNTAYDPWQFNQNTYMEPITYQPFNGALMMDPFAWDPNAQPVGAPPRLQAPSTHPMVRLDALSKLYNQTTVRSNVFAVWLTVGFFEVEGFDPNRVPQVILGEEYGLSKGRNVRMKMFCILDRTKLYAYETKTMGPIVPQADPNTGDAAFQVVPINAITPFLGNTSNQEPRSKRNYNLYALAQQQPLVLTIDPDMPNEETVEAFPGPNANQLQAQFRRQHAANARVISRGNPGPMKNYSVATDHEFVVYWTVLD